MRLQVLFRLCVHTGVRVSDRTRLQPDMPLLFHKVPAVSPTYGEDVSGIYEKRQIIW